MSFLLPHPVGVLPRHAGRLRARREPAAGHALVVLGVEETCLNFTVWSFTFIDWVSVLNFENYGDFYIPPLPVMQPGKVI